MTKNIDIRKYAFDLKKALDEFMNIEPKKGYITIKEFDASKHRKKKSKESNTG